jgi:hypothetical protein
LAPPHVFAAAQRTFVKSDGLDTNVCSLAAPCRSFAKAIANTLVGGEVVVLDSAGYGPVTISQSVSIVAPRGVYAGINVPGLEERAVVVDGAGITVVLEGLTINATGAGLGILFTQGNELHVKNCSIVYTNPYGIHVTAPNSRLFVSNTVMLSSSVGVSGSVSAVVDRVRLHRAQGGIYASDGASLSVRESVVTNGALGVIGVASTGVATRITIDDSVFADDWDASLKLDASGPIGSVATLDVARSTITRTGVTYPSVPANGALVTATAPATAVLVITGSQLSDNTSFGIALGGNAIALATDNVFSGNSSGGIAAGTGAVAHTRSNNTGVQATPTAGMVVPVAGF